ncbi:phage P22-like portal protein [Cupriavidus phytorum]|uniref:Phage P22-like portal protein n=1 Tax=Cupriavidus phytorum TaxID=3024399 RepID=A0A2W7PS68_9BURK|nr:portal protein [Cupriavidus alkaliphilus]PZX29465.1 phage P22-like portal protein [Cupriavidus alkaliphilus]
MAESKDDNKRVKEAHKRFARCQEAESEFRNLFLDDLRFVNGDSDNGWQWPEEVWKSREAERRPRLTVNKTKQHNRQITNDARQNKPSVRVSPVDGGADKKTAEIINGIIRHIEANSSADTAYDTAAEFAVDGGIGYWRVITDYASDDSFEQEIYIKRVKNPMNVYLDPDIQEADGSDAKFGFVFEDLLKEEFEARYPGFDAVGWPMEGGSDWLSKDKIRLAEYFHVVDVEDTLIADEQGNVIRMSEVRPEDKAMIEAMPKQRTRKVKRRTVKWCLIAGDQEIEYNDWPGRYIPIVRVVGEEVDIDGKTERKGHTRYLKDPARMYNYWTSSAVEFVALQGKTPWVGPAEAREGYERYWDTANTANHSYLPYNHLDETGGVIPPPQRQQPPVMAAAYIQGMQTAAEELKMASGQYDASMGAKSNETSGRAIMARQREGDTATFHFVDNVARAIKYTGMILVDLIPKIYDTPRVVRILGEDGSEDTVQIDPTQKQSVVESKDLAGEIQTIYNPGVGRYDVTVRVGPSYTTRRQEAFDAMTQMAQGNPQLLQQAGDLIMKAADFPMADELAERLEKFLPPGVKDDKESPEAAALKQQMQELQAQLQTLGQEYNKLHEDKETDREKNRIAAFQAETDRAVKLAPYLPPESASYLAAVAARQMVDSPDIYPGVPMQPQMAPPVSQEASPEAPPSAGFLIL